MARHKPPAVMLGLLLAGLGLGANIARALPPPPTASAVVQAPTAAASLPDAAASAEQALPDALPALPPIPEIASDDPWRAALQDFDRANAAQPFLPGGVVFVGSSSIRLWSGLERQFANWPHVIKRGFGGSQLADCVRNAQRLVSLYKPSLVLLYAGDNDLAAGRSPAQVQQAFEAFVAKVRARQPDLPVAFISIKPSPSRAGLLGGIREANRLIKDYAANARNVYFVDVFTPMLGADGRPRADLFGPDALHMSPAGYALWKDVISTSLPPSLLAGPR